MTAVAGRTYTWPPSRGHGTWTVKVRRVSTLTVEIEVLRGACRGHRHAVYSVKRDPFERVAVQH